MSSNPPETERPRNPTHFGGEGLYEAQSDDDASSMRVSLGDHLDSSTRQELLAERADSALAFARRNWVPVLIAAGAIGLLVGAFTRRSFRD
jgi:hypothetical protein